MAVKHTVETFVQAAHKKHDNRYDYKHITQWTSNREKLTIVCPEHGEFQQTGADHLRGSGCPECSRIKKASSLSKNPDHFIARAREAHGDKYDYSHWVGSPISWHKKAVIVCPDHGPFEQLVGSHIKGRGCESCGKIQQAKSKIVPLSEWIARAREIHGDVYDYSNVADRIQNHVQFEVLCTVHNTCFTTTWNQHISSEVKCPQCMHEQKQSKELAEWGVHHHKQRHLGADALQIMNNPERLKSLNHDDGWTIQKIADHVGCNVTTMYERFKLFELPVKNDLHTSQGERDLREWLSQHVHLVANDRTLIHPQELDIVIPSHNLAVEYCGLYWHSDVYRDRNYHLRKLEACNARGIRLITIFEDEWKDRQHIVLSKLKSILGLDDAKLVHARKCQIVMMTREQKQSFFDQYHIQGSGPGSVTYGLVHEGVIVAAMTFIKQQGGRWDLNRFATSTRIPGGFSKLLAHFKRSHQWSEIVSFADRRWSEGDLYNKSGFTLEKVLPPDYYYTDTKIRKHKFNFRHKNLPKILGEQYNPNETEFQNMDRTQFLRIWNCGLLRYVTRSTN